MPRWTNPKRRLRKKRRKEQVRKEQARKEQVYNDRKRKPYLFIAVADDDEYGF